MTGMADEEDVTPFLDEPLGLAMDFGDQGAGRIDIGKAAVLRRRGHGLWNSVRGKYDGPVVWNLVKLVDEYGAHAFQTFDYEPVMDDFVAHVDG
jgi:hypothetical protein